MKYECISQIDDTLCLKMSKYRYSLSSIEISNYFKEHDESTVLINICKGLPILHKNGICHGNIKPSNILFNDENEYILSDYCQNELFIS